MGSTLAYAGPQLGQAAQGFVQGRQLRTQEDEARQSIALRAAEEGRAKEQHRLSIQQLGLQIQGMMQAQEQAAQLFGPQLTQAQQATRPGSQIDPGATQGLQQAVPGLQLDPNVTWNEGLSIASLMGQNQRAEEMSKLGWGRVAAQADEDQRKDDVQWARLQAQNLREDIRWKRTELKQTDATITKLKTEMADEAEIAEAELYRQGLAEEIRQAENDLKQYSAEISPKSGITSTVPSRGKPVPP